MLTNKFFFKERAHPSGFGGVQRIYRFNNGFGLSVVNTSELHSYQFAWEIAILENVDEEGYSFDITYNTPLTDDVEVFYTDEETNEFIEHAEQVLSKL